MELIFLVVYVLFIGVLFAGAVHWARKKNREFKNPSTRHKVSPTSKFFVKDLPRDFYVSVQFCVVRLPGGIPVQDIFSLREVGLARGPKLDPWPGRFCQPQRDRGASTELALDLHPSTVEFHDFLDDAHAQARARDVAGGVNAVKALTDA